MKRRFFVWIPLLALAAGTVLISACEEEWEGEGSHNAGKNCLSCHKSGGEGEGIFTVGGTVYNSSGSGMSGVTVELFDNADRTGSPVASLTSDGSGNFHTTSKITFGIGLYATLTSGSKSASMSSAITTGACNSCHGVSAGKIVVQ
jgi:cytochrome c553